MPACKFNALAVELRLIAHFGKMLGRGFFFWGKLGQVVTLQFGQKASIADDDGEGGAQFMAQDAHELRFCAAGAFCGITGAAQLFDALIAGSVLNHIAKERGKGDHGGSACDDQCDQLVFNWIGIDRLRGKRCDLKGGHTGKMQQNNGQGQERGHPQDTGPHFAPCRAECKCRQNDRDDHRGREILNVPIDRALHPIGNHASVMHGGNRQSKDGSPKDRRAGRLAQPRDDNAQSRADDGDDQRQKGQ